MNVANACVQACSRGFHPLKCPNIEREWLCAQADEPLAKFLDYCTYGHMIDNVVLIVTGTLHERDVHVSPFLCT